MSVAEIFAAIARLNQSELRELRRLLARLDDGEGGAGVREPRTPLPRSPRYTSLANDKAADWDAA